MLFSAQTMSRESSITMTPPEPAIEPAAASESKSIGISSIDISRSIVEPSACLCFSLNRSSARKTFAELPPGMTAFSLRPGSQAAGHLVDQFAHRDRADFDFEVAGLLHVAADAEMRVPVLFGLPSCAYSAPPMAMMCFTWQSVSTLFTMVGHM